MKKKREERVLSCHICNKTGFKNSHNLKAHLFQHKAIPARFTCNQCPKEYFRSDEYNNHIAAHLKTKRLYYCDHCERGFVDKRNLILHLNVHDELPTFYKHRYKCAACGVDYCEERLLKYHIRRVHLNPNNTKPVYVSKNLNETWIENIQGSKKCVQITKTKTNMLTMKPCQTKFGKDLSGSTRNIFQEYMATVFAMKDNHYSKAICDYCGKEMLKKSITAHIRERHLKLRRFRCDVCGKTFKRHYQLCLHVCGKDGRRRRKVVKPS